ncbi:MAG: hypothetical protein AAFO91_07805 [Bacteroidota bacterium]
MRWLYGATPTKFTSGRATRHVRSAIKNSRKTNQDTLQQNAIDKARMHPSAAQQSKKTLTIKHQQTQRENDLLSKPQRRKILPCWVGWSILDFRDIL